MNNTVEPTANLQLEVLDLAALRQSIASCNHQMIDIEVFHTQTAYLPSLYGRFNRLNSTLNQANIRLRDATQRLQQHLVARTTALRGLLVEHANAFDDAERLEILGEVANELNETLSATRTQTSILADSLLSVSEAFDRTSTLRNLAGFSAEQERLPEEIKQLEARRAKVEEERATVTAAINAIESKGFGAIAKDTVLTGERVAAMGVTSPEAAAIQLGLDLLKQSLDNMDAALNFLGLVSLRDRLRARSNDFSATLRAKNTDLDILNRRIRMIHAAHAFDDHLQDYKREFSKVVASLRAYQIRFNRMPNVDEAGVQAFIAQTTTLATYLQPVRQRH
ncbi:MAG: hypothetical protein JWQ69_2390 [Pseudomonas sp.]|nr:hypothetical protein [Pseudomonas sp.]